MIWSVSILKEITIPINDMVSKHRRHKWRELLEESNFGSKRLWAIIKKLTNSRKSGNLGIYFGTNASLGRTKYAQAFCRQFVEHRTKPDKQLRVVKRKIRTLVRSEELSFSGEDVLTIQSLARQAYIKLRLAIVFLIKVDSEPLCLS